MLISPFSAISSWEGYEYQGHIAIYVALKKIKKLLEEDNNLIDNMILEIEGAEDFSIKKNNKYLTLHQVKSGKINLDEGGKKDKFSFIISLLQYEANEGFFHILPNKNIPTDFVESTVSHIDFLISELGKEIKLKDEVSEDKYGNYIMTHKISQKSKKGSLYDILKFVCNENYDISNVKKSIKNIKKDLQKFLKQLKPDKEVLIDNKFVSKYNPSFENSIVLKEESYKIIVNILKMKRSEWSFVNEDYAKFVYYKLYVELKNLIEKDFIKNPKKEKGSEFKLSKMLEIIIKNYKNESNNIDYQYYLVWKSIKEKYKEFPKKNSKECEVKLCNDCKINESCNLFTQIKIISEKETDDLNKFLYRIMLMKPEKGKPNNLPNDNLINRLFIKMLKEIEILKFGKNNIIQARKNGKFYRLTLDSSGEINELDEKLKNANNSDKLLIRENDVLITDQIEKENHIYNSIDINVMGENERKDLENITSINFIDQLKKNFNKPKVIRIIKRGTAKGELSNE